MGLKKGQHHKGQFKSGVSGNPGGRKPLPEDVKAIATSTKPQLIRTYWKFANMSLSEVKNYKPENLIESGILNCLKIFAASGSTDQIKYIWAECHGKPRETIDATISTDNKELEDVIQMTNEFIKQNNK
jgi:hypothetical protein